MKYLSEEDKKIAKRALESLHRFFFEHSAIYSKELMKRLEEDTSVKWFDWSTKPVKPTQFSPNRPKYWPKRLFSLRFATVVRSHPCDGMDFYFIRPFGSAYKQLKGNEKKLVEKVKEEHSNE